MLDRILSALVAFSLALLVWLYARSRDQEILDNVPIPVRIALTTSQAGLYDLEIPGPAQVPVSFSGPPVRIRELRTMLQRGDLRVDYTLTVPVDRLPESRYADTVRIDVADLHVPPGVSPLLVEDRNRIPVTLHRLSERRLPVRFEQSTDDHVGPTIVEPATVLVRGPKDLLDHLRSIPTLPYALPSRTEPVSRPETLTVGPVSLVREIEGRPIQVQPETVTARVTLPPRQKLYELTDVPVQFLCPANFGFRPKFRGEGRDGKITLRLLGPAAEETPAVFAYIDLTKGKFQPGLNEEPLRLQLPRDYQLAQNSPRSVAFELLAIELPAKELGIVQQP